MLFDSLSFLIFFPVVFLVHFALPARYRQLFLLLVSCYFYMAFVPVYILILLLLIVIDYVSAIKIEQSNDPKKKKLYLGASVASVLSVLFLFKYFNFFSGTAASLAHLLHWNYGIQALRIALPIGLSFHTFQSLAYVIEVYKGRFPAERSFITYALYVLFFPQLVAGPIERPAHLLPQLRALTDFNYANAVEGLSRMLWGFFKKLVIADNVALLVDHVYGNLAHTPGPTLAIALAAFSVQLYADFSGYCDIAIGTARMFGVTLTENFTNPYFSRSIAEFWRRWHISLSTWFRDYVYSPLAWKLSRYQSGFTAIASATVITFALTGLWHGAGLTYLCMGLLYGFYIVFGMWTKKVRQKIEKGLGSERFPRTVSFLRTIVVCTLVSVAWVFFRAKSLADVGPVLKGLLAGWGGITSLTFLRYGLFTTEVLGIGKADLLGVVFATGVLFVVEYFSDGRSLAKLFSALPKGVRLSGYYAVLLAILFFGTKAPNTFIYFQF